MLNISHAKTYSWCEYSCANTSIQLSSYPYYMGSLNFHLIVDPLHLSVKIYELPLTLNSCLLGAEKPKYLLAISSISFLRFLR